MLNVFRRRIVSAVAVGVLCFGGVVSPAAVGQGLSSEDGVVYGHVQGEQAAGTDRDGLDGSEPGFNDSQCLCSCRLGWVSINTRSY